MMNRCVVRNHLPLASLMLWIVLVLSPASAQLRRLKGIEQRSRAVVLVARTSNGEVVAAAGMERSTTMRRQAGSLYKLPISLALLRSGRFNASMTYRCSGSDTINGTRRTCWINSGHGALRFVQALSQSCNLYFRRFARLVERQAILKAARDLGLYTDAVAPIDPEHALSDDDLLEGTAEYTPSQILRTALVVATRGRIAAGGSARDLSSGRFAPLYQGLRLAVVRGTARRAWSRRIAIAGKTGTAPLARGGTRTVGWFLGFAPVDHPRFAVVVAVDDGRGFEAAALAREALEELL